ncbi:P-type conjugative transfer protein VirB9 [Pasteurella multocida]|uniref:P-type conjugative transfer protein VirB9 n=1 Tax=Pasteurella multocida TaxID=747 RepID=UPI000CE9077B|nr:P-type conjugative transfer protein VirB9 [Pasteurella multocida]PPE94935.1 P-type conjugative transfer protein VirB9 [Pasteurella multocida]PPE95028.1 P-type conjugative transfer protein VirB9 [Pasteurella multocida]
MKKSLLALLMISFTLNSFALDIPKSSKFDERMQYINYNANDVTEIKAKDGFVTAISFSNDETINDIAVGFSGGWEVRDNRNNVYIRPKAFQQGDGAFFEPTVEQWDTNLLIVTNKYSYAFDLKLVNDNKDRSAYFMKFAYPTEEQLKRNAEAKAKAEKQRAIAQQKAEKSEAEAVSKSLDKFTVPRNWDYTMRVGKDSREIAPKFTYDDGVRTYIGFDTTNSIPSVFYYQGEQEMMSNASVKKQGEYTVVVVHKTATRFILRSGDQVVGIVNYGFGKNPNSQVATTTNDVIRTIK